MIDMGWERSTGRTYYYQGIQDRSKDIEVVPENEWEVGKQASKNINRKENERNSNHFLTLNYLHVLWEQAGRDKNRGKHAKECNSTLVHRGPDGENQGNFQCADK